MGKAFTLEKNSKCGECKAPINEGDIYTIIYDSGKIKYLQCDNCEVDDRIQHYRKTGEISTMLMMEASSANYHYTENADMSRLRDDVRHFFLKYKKDLQEIATVNNQIQEIIRKFENKHWLPYLKKYWNDTDLRGHIAKVGRIKAMMWGSAGRVLITVGLGNDDVTMIFSDSKSQITANGGLQSISGSQKTAIEILQKLVDADKIVFKPKKSVKLAGL